jgi:subtilase family serine protease
VQLVVIALGLAGALIASGVVSATASVRHVRLGSKPAIPAGARALGALPAGTQLQLTVALRPQDPSGLQTFATDVSTPGSPLFRHYLTVSEFASRFGATDQQVAAVEASLRADGLTVGSVPANNLTVPVTGTAAQVEKAFSVSLAQVKLAGGRTAYANAEAPAVQSTISPYVQGVVGLDNLGTYQSQGLSRTSAKAGRLARPRAIPHAATGGPTPCSAATAVAQNNGGYTADVIAQAYQFQNYYLGGDTGAGQTVALFELQPYDPTDIAQYQLCYGTHVPITNVDVDGGPGPYTPGKSDDGEAALDLEQVIGLAPGASIQVYEGPNSSAGALDTLSKIVTTDQAKVVSSSFGICEALAGGTSMNSENNLYSEAAAQGQSYFVASGDQGSASCSANQPTNTSLSVLDPAAQPFVTGVGGSSLYASVNGKNVFFQPGDTPIESVWNDGSTQNAQGQAVAHATTGGLSSQWPMPSYQSGSAASLGVINANSHNGPCGAALCRETPDVSADGDAATGYAVFANGNSNGGWTIIGGTSAASPLWAAFTALANASSTCRGTTLGFENPSLYSIGGSSYLNNFRDVSTASPITGDANNDALGTNNGLFPVTPNYDLTTGIGTPLAATLGPALCGARAPVFAVTVSSPGNLTTTVGQPVSLQIPGSDAGGLPLTFTASALPAGLTMSAAGLITGTPTTPQSVPVTISAGDNDANTGSASFTWTIALPVGKPTNSGVAFGGLSKRKPSLKFTLAAGLNAPALKSVAVTLPGGLSFAKKAKSLSKGISVKSSGKKLKVKLVAKKGTLTITLKSSATKLTVTIAKPAISETGGLASKVKHHKVKKLTVKLKATDTSNKSTTYSIKLKAK